MEKKTEQSPIDIILNDDAFQKKLARISVQIGETHEQVNAKAKTYLTELYAEHNPATNVIFVELAQYLLGQGYDKTIDVNPNEIKALTKLMRKHPIAFVLTHKSYVDLLVLMLVLARHGLPLPYMFAGINLDLFGVGKLARKNGVIYIRRSFKDNWVYKAALRHFITHLLNQQANFMWALEGTRSRTGKLLWPQMGILKYIMEADHDAHVQVKYVPVSIVYDLIPDVEEMTKEGRGKKKNPENIQWLINYWRQFSKDKMGRISLRIGEAVDFSNKENIELPDDFEGENAKNTEGGNKVSDLAFQLANRINEITPITTTSLICTSLLSKFAASKGQIENDIAHLMQLIETHKQDALVDRGRPIGESVQAALNLLTKANIFLLQGDGVNARYTIFREHYLQATYYANMAVHHLYRRAFIEMALVKIIDLPVKERSVAFWTDIMALRDLFKFEFFYAKKTQFVSEIEADLSSITPNWEDILFSKKTDIKALLEKQNILIAPVLLFNYIEAYRVVAHGLQIWDNQQTIQEDKFVNYCLFLGEEMHWQGRIRRIEAVSKPFLQNGVRLANNLHLIPTEGDSKKKKIEDFTTLIEDVATRINLLQGITLSKPIEATLTAPIEREIVPGSTMESITKEIMQGEKGAHIGAFFDLDRTLIKGFSAKDFLKARLMSGKVTPKEVVAQFAGALSYAIGNGNFASMAALSAKGVKGTPEQTFIEVGEEVYNKYLAKAIYPESRALVAAHLAMGHTVAIVSAATPYQVEPIARDLKIPHVMCTRMEVKKGVFTGKIIEPACWGEGKAIAGQSLAQTHHLDLHKSYFYTDSAEDLPLLEIVGNPRPLNADSKLAALAFKNDWTQYRFTEENSSTLTNLARTGLTGGIFIPAILRGVTQGVMNMSWTEGIESMMAGVGDFGTAAAGINLAVKGEEHLWSSRPCVFILNHQSNADFLIAAKLIRKGARGIAKKELQKMPIVGQMLQAAGTIFLDRENKEKSIEALAPAVESLKNGTSVVIFPEGTRSYDYTLGKFKKGAFHLAVQAGVPLVPIVLKNAHDAMPRGSNIFKPTLVEVVVLPPISTEDWTKENMGEQIEKVRTLFLRELGQV
jgi:putative phosphoserine phosphatase/1-acylglycerol-3-phosphate O-acyltransferase